MSTTLLPVGVVMPTLNVEAALPGHLARMRQWAPLVREIVVVDSHSTDGTLEFIRRNLQHPKLRLLEHPRGLYQSWNFGIRQLTAKYAYISTAGDTIQAEGLRHLVDVAEAFGSDITVSPPRLETPQHEPFPEKQWPIHKLLAQAGVTQPMRLPAWQVFLLALLEVPEGLIGSSAGNLYRTETLQRHPFPSDYGHAGDVAWHLEHALETSLALTPEAPSRFVIEAGGPPDFEMARRLMARLVDLAERTVAQAVSELASGASPRVAPESATLLPLIRDVVSQIAACRARQRAYHEARQRMRPWWKNPEAWRARAARQRQRKCLTEAYDCLIGHPAASADAHGAVSTVASYLARRLRDV